MAKALRQHRLSWSVQSALWNVYKVCPGVELRASIRSMLELRKKRLVALLNWCQQKPLLLVSEQGGQQSADWIKGQSCVGDSSAQYLNTSAVQLTLEGLRSWLSSRPP